MANFCNFDIRIKGRRGNALLLAHSIATIDGGNISVRNYSGENCEINVTGACKWSVNFAVTDEWDGFDIDTDLNLLPESLIIEQGTHYQNYSLRVKSQVLQCEVLARYWSEESEFDYFDHYVNGKRIKKRRIEYTDFNRFDWTRLEYHGHEGEDEDSEHREGTILLFANRFSSDYDPESIVSLLADHPIDMIDDIESEKDELLAQWHTGETVSLNHAIEFTVPDGFFVKKTKNQEGEETLKIEGGLYYQKGQKEYLLDSHITTPEEDIIPFSEWRKNYKDSGKNYPYLLLPGTHPVLMETVSTSVSLLDIDMHVDLMQVCLYFSDNQCIKLLNPLVNYDHEKFLLFLETLLQLLKNLRINGQPLHIDGLTVGEMDRLLYPLHENRKEYTWTFRDQNIYSNNDWSITLPDHYTSWNHTPAELNHMVAFVQKKDCHVKSDSDLSSLSLARCEDIEKDDKLRYADACSKQGLERFLALLNLEDLGEEYEDSYIYTVHNDQCLAFMCVSHYDDGMRIASMLRTKEKVAAIHFILPASEDDNDRLALIASVQRMLSSFRFAHSKLLPISFLIDQPSCLNNLLSGNMQPFDDAIEEMKFIFSATFVGARNYLDHYSANGYLNKNLIRQTVAREMKKIYVTLSNCMDKADAFLANLHSHSPSKETLNYVYKKLNDLNLQMVYNLKTTAPDQNAGISFFSTHDSGQVIIHMPFSLLLRFENWKNYKSTGKNKKHMPPPVKPSFDTNAPLPTAAKEDVLVWSVQNDGTIKINEYNGTETDVVIPEQINGNTVTALGLRTTEESVTVASSEDQSTQFESHKKEDPTNEHSCYTQLQEHTTTPPVEHFYDADEIKPSFSIENGVLKHTDIPEGCTRIIIPEGVVELAANCLLPANTDVVDLDNSQQEIYHNLTLIHFPQSLKRIGDNALCDLETPIEKILLPESLEEIGYRGCAGFGQLCSISIPHSVKRIKANAFEECSLNNITIRSSSTKVYCGAFGKLGDNTFITLPQELVYYTKPYYVQEDNITVTVSTSPAASEPEFHIQDGVLLGVYLPANCHTVTLPDTIEKIAKNVFFYSNIESVVLPNSLKLIEEHAFNHCNKLKNITILPGNESIIIEGDAFSNGFDDITKLESITISNPNALVYYDAFDLHHFNPSSHSITLNIPHTLAYMENFYPFANIHYLDSADHTTPTNEPVLTIHKNELIGAYIPKECTHIAIPEGITAIHRFALAHTSIESIDFPKTLHTLGLKTGALTGCSNVRKIILPEGIRFLPLEAFDHCENLEFLYIPTTIKIIRGAAEGCASLKTVVCPNEKVVSLWESDCLGDRKNIFWFVPFTLEYRARELLGSEAKVFYLTETECNALKDGMSPEYLAKLLHPECITPEKNIK